MIKSKLYTYLKEYLGEYLYGLQEDQLDVALLSGVINFTNANFRPDKVNALFADQMLPFTLKAGLIGSLQVKYHYSSLLSNPVEVTVDTLLLVLGPLMCQTGEPDTRYSEPSLTEENISADQIFLKRFARDKRKKEFDSSDSSNSSGEDGGDEFVSQQDSLTDTQAKVTSMQKDSTDISAEKHEGLLARYFTKVMKNLTMKVTNVHIRYEDDVYLFNNPFSCGVCLKSLAVKTVSQEWMLSSEDSLQVSHRAPRRGAIAKEVSVSSLSVYVNPLSSMLIPTSLWEATQSSPIGIFDALPAYEVRELAIQEAEHIISEGSHAVIAPLTVSFTITLDTEAPKVKMCIPLTKPLEVRITAAMVDTVRSFLDYHTNVKLWPFMRRYRPFERVLLIPRSDDEPDFVSAKRRRIARKWFIYACRFIQAKRKILELIRRKKHQISKERSKMKKKERYVRQPEIESSMDASGSFLMDEGEVKTDSPEPTSLIPKNVKKTMSFLVVRPRVTPGTSTMNLSAAVNEYNKSIMTSPAHTASKSAKLEHAKAKTHSHFGPPFNNCEVEVRAAGLIITISDEVQVMKCTLENVSSHTRIENDVLRKRVGIGCLAISIRDPQEESVLLRLGKKEVVKEEVVRGGMFSKGQRKAVVVEKAERGLDISFTYMPTAFRAEGELHPTAKMYEVTGHSSQVNLSYSHTIVMQLIDLVAAFCKENADSAGQNTLKEIDRKHTSQLNFREKFVKKYRKIRHASALVLFASQELAKKAMSLKGTLPVYLREADDFIDPINLSLKLDFGGLNFSLMDRAAGAPATDFHLPGGKFEFEKLETRLKLLLWGFGVTAASSICALESFFLVRHMQAAKTLIEEKMKHGSKRDEDQREQTN